MKHPQFKHDCSQCIFHGRGFFMGKPVDWYTCQQTDGLRTVVARHSDDGSSYSSATIGEGVTPSIVVIAALAQGLDLTEPEKDKLIGVLLSLHRQRLGMSFWKDCMDPNSDEHNQIGPADWLQISL